MKSKTIETFIHKGEALAIIIYASFQEQGIRFVTPKEFPQQLGFLSYTAGSGIQAHIHRNISRTISTTQEILIMRKGKLKVNFYDNDQNYIDSRILSKGDVILLAAGGHGFTMLTDAQIIEIKQGPYIDEKQDKVKFDGKETI